MSRTVFMSLVLCCVAGAATGDETCQSPFLPKIVGQEDYVYVWTLGVEGWGDGSDKVVTMKTPPVIC